MSSPRLSSLTATGGERDTLPPSSPSHRAPASAESAAQVPEAPRSGSFFNLLDEASRADADLEKDETSIPPMGDLDSHFFDAPSSWRDFEPEALDPRMVAISSDAAKSRRAYFRRYVVGVVGLSVALCATAVLKESMRSPSDERSDTRPFGTEVTRSHGGEGALAQETTGSAPQPTEGSVAPSIVPGESSTGNFVAAAPSAAASVTGAPAETVASVAALEGRPAAAGTPGAQDTAAPIVVAAAEPSPSAAVDSDDRARSGSSPKLAAAAANGADPAALAREKARSQLDRGRTEEAIEAAQRSVSLDPSDGEAWLILGAAYQERGNGAEARRCYKACIEQGTRGPKSECRAMLQ